MVVLELSVLFPIRRMGWPVIVSLLYWPFCKCKNKGVPMLSMKVCGRSRGIAAFILNSGIRWRLVITSHPSHLIFRLRMPGTL